MTRGTLFIVATPIGCLEDITLRALETLKTVDCIACEDTRHSRKLMNHFAITTPLIALHEHNEQQMAESLLTRLQQGQSIALISDAGTPLISDPGFRLVNLARAAGIRVSPLPGACALIAALCVSGLPSASFQFLGFLPAKGVVRDKVLRAHHMTRATLIFYEAPHRLQATLSAMTEIFGAQRQACLARELTKTFETVMTGPLGQVTAQVAGDPNQRKGEMVILLAGNTDKVEGDMQAAVKLYTQLAKALPPTQATKLAAEIAGVKKAALYAFIHV